jgi:dTDP-4-dehydrorhamnose 3,5-epimerase
MPTAITSRWSRSKRSPVPFEFTALEIPGLVLIQPKVFGDDRGFFLELYKHTNSQARGLKHLVRTIIGSTKC